MHAACPAARAPVALGYALHVSPNDRPNDTNLRPGGPSAAARAGESAGVALVVENIGVLATPRGDAAHGGAELGAIDVDERGGLVLVADAAGRIAAVGTPDEIGPTPTDAPRLDAGGGLVVPGLVDPHTHPVFLGTRDEEFERRLRGESYVEIAAAGGGIRSSLAGVRGASAEELLAALLVRLDRFLQLGTTTVEAKTGYGLTVADELKGLDVIRAARSSHDVDLVATCLGAHDVPPEYAGDADAYVEIVSKELWPLAVEHGAQYADVFTEAHTFDIEASRRLMLAARDVGLTPRMHVDQLTPLGGAELAAEVGAATADHLEHVSERGIEALLGAGVQPVLCPLVPLFLRETDEAPARRMVEAGLAPALSTDFNPGSCYCMSLFETMSWGALRYGLSAAEALTAVTLNAACTLGLGADRGTLEVGKRADLVVTDLPGVRHLTYELGRSPVVATVKDGRVAYRAGGVR